MSKCLLKLIRMKSILFLFTSFLFFSCGEDYTPKPRGFFRIGFPEKKYEMYDPSGCPYSFEIPVYGQVIPDQNRYAEPCWINLVFPQFNAEVNISYKPVTENVGKFIEDSRTLAYKHTVKANAIDEKLISNPDHHVYGLFYEIGGDAASSVQFFVTDSSSHFLRGALYFNAVPKSDSLAPVIDFLLKDIRHMVGSLKWK